MMPDDPLALLTRSGAYAYKGKLTLPAFTSVGADTLAYYTREFETLCSDCATTDYFEWLYSLTVNRHDLPYALGYDDPPVYVDTYDEGPDEICAGCNKHIESSYGDPDDITE